MEERIEEVAMNVKKHAKICNFKFIFSYMIFGINVFSDPTLILYKAMTHIVGVTICAVSM